MKKFIREFFKRGFISAWGGPFVLAIIYFIVGKIENLQSIPINEVSLGILSITFMAFTAGGITAIYQNDVLPLASSIMIHAAVLYLDYLIMYLFNDWLPRSEIGIFTPRPLRILINMYIPTTENLQRICTLKRQC